MTWACFSSSMRVTESQRAADDIDSARPPAQTDVSLSSPAGSYYLLQMFALTLPLANHPTLLLLSAHCLGLCTIIQQFGTVLASIRYLSGLCNNCEHSVVNIGTQQGREARDRAPLPMRVFADLPGVLADSQTLTGMTAPSLRRSHH